MVDAGYISKNARYREKNRGQSSNLYTLILQNEKIEEEKKDCAENGDNVEQIIENYFGDNGKGVISLEMVLKQEDAEHISFERMLSEKKAVQETILQEYQSSRYLKF